MTITENQTELELYFQNFEKILELIKSFISPFGENMYTDWTASGRLYAQLKKINEFGPFVANTHTETTVSGTMTKAYHKARHIIKDHVNADA
jgi:selenocysteine lyase/cysteine desulfurase